MKCHIHEGNLEPLHHQEVEREIIVNQMSNLLTRCTQEMLEQKKMFRNSPMNDQNKEISDRLDSLKILDD